LALARLGARLMADAERCCPAVVGQRTPDNGVIIPDGIGADRLGQHYVADRAQCCRLHGVPLGVHVPWNVAELVECAMRLRRRSPDEAAPVWALARELLAEAEKQLEEGRRR
jgi:hypothetical protein